MPALQETVSVSSTLYRSHPLLQSRWHVLDERVTSPFVRCVSNALSSIYQPHKRRSASLPSFITLIHYPQADGTFLMSGHLPYGAYLIFCSPYTFLTGDVQRLFHLSSSLSSTTPKQRWQALVSYGCVFKVSFSIYHPHKNAQHLFPPLFISLIHYS